jgi:rhodanese-related sulfurtransferase
MVRGLVTAVCAAALAVPPAFAQSSRITEGMAGFEFSLNGQSMVIDRRGAACPPACVQPVQAAPGVVTIGELEVLEFLDLFVTSGQGLLVDARLPEAFGAGTVPGAVNIPAPTLSPDNPYRDDLLHALGLSPGELAASYDLVVFSAGPDDARAPAALRSLIAAGYPASRLKYYRGGMMAWRGLGLSEATGG